MARCQRGRDGGVVGDRRGGAGGAGAVVLRHRRRGTQTVMTQRPSRSGEGYVGTRCLLGGTQTIMTRRPHRSGAGYVITRCRRSGTQTAMPRRVRCGGGSLMARCPRRGGCATADRPACCRDRSQPVRAVRQTCLAFVSLLSMGGYWRGGVGRNGGRKRVASGTYPPAPSPTMKVANLIRWWSGPLPHPPPSRRGREPVPGPLRRGGRGDRT